MNVTLEPAQIGPGTEEEILTVGVTIGSICTFITLLDTAALLTHPVMPERVQLTAVPFKSELEEKVFELVPTGLPPALQLYVGVALPLVMVAVKVILVPLHTAPFGLAVMLIVGIRIGFTVMVT